MGIMGRSKVAPEPGSIASTSSASSLVKNRLESEPRRCKDLLFLLLFIVFWVGMLYIAGVSIENGKPERLIYGIDSHGFTCGAKNDAINGPDLSNSKKLYFLDPLALQSTRSLTGLKRAKKVCIQECPSVAASLLPATTHKVCPFSGLYTGGCEDAAYYTCPYYAASGVSSVPVNATAAVAAGDAGVVPVPAWSTTYYSSFAFLVAGASPVCPVTAYGLANAATDPCGFKFSTKVIGEGPCYVRAVANNHARTHQRPCTAA